jgi:hypothetical protein
MFPLTATPSLLGCSFVYKNPICSILVDSLSPYLLSRGSPHVGAKLELRCGDAPVARLLLQVSSCPGSSCYVESRLTAPVTVLFLAVEGQGGRDIADTGQRGLQSSLTNKIQQNLELVPYNL